MKRFQKTAEEGTLVSLFYEVTITLIPKPDKDITKKRKLQANITDENPQKNISKPNYHDQVGFIPGMQGFFSIHKSVNILDLINKLKSKNHMIISIDAEKVFDKIQLLFLIRTLQKVGVEGTYLNSIQALYNKPTANIILNGEELKLFPLRSGIRQGCPLSQFYST